MNWLYLLLDIGAISVPFIASFYPKARFADHWSKLVPAIMIPGIFFIIWDVYFTKWGIWGFNKTYLLGFDILGLPIEEWLFFICIPYACVFTYFALGVLVKKDYLAAAEKYISWALVAGGLLLGFMNLDKWYTATTFIFLAIFIGYLKLVLKPTFLSRFYFTFLFILIPFFLITGLLTGSGIEDQVVWYNDAENLGIRMGTIPFEDTFYGMLLLMMNVAIFDKLSTQKQ
ncbi:MAG: lycopene cyclase domain-containing protein [Fulvivirga sp.]